MRSFPSFRTSAGICSQVYLEEQSSLTHPELAGKPLAVGGDPEARHGIVLTADYEAKKYGVKTGMALWQFRRSCRFFTLI